MIAGCGAQPSPERQPTETAEPTLPPNITTYTETKPLPEPDGIQSRAAARSFVETYEQQYVYNQLVTGFGNTEPATEITVEPSEAAIVYTTERGYYLLSACRGSAEFYQPNGSSSMRTNEISVAHFVGDGLHRRIPFNAYRCMNPIVPTPTDDKQETPRHGCRSTTSRRSPDLYSAGDGRRRREEDDEAPARVRRRRRDFRCT